MKHYIVYYWLLITTAFAANIQLKDLPETTTAASTDIVGLQIDVTGTMRDRKMTLANLAINLDPQLTAIANSSPVANQIWLWSGASNGSFLTLSANAQSLITAADYAAMRTLLSVVGISDTQTITGKIVTRSAALSTDDTYQGNDITGLNNSGGVTQWDAVYLNSSSQWVLADADGSSTFPCRGLVTATASTGNASTVVTQGTVRNDAWNWTPGGTVYLSTTAGGLTQTAPTASGSRVQVIGFALTADILYVNPSPDIGTNP